MLNGLESDPNYEFIAKLTIKGITQEIKFGAIVNIKGNKITATTSIVFDRSKFDIQYKSTSFFGDLGDKFIEDEITINIRMLTNLVE